MHDYTEHVDYTDRDLVANAYLALPDGAERLAFKSPVENAVWHKNWIVCMAFENGDNREDAWMTWCVYTNEDDNQEPPHWTDVCDWEPGDVYAAEIKTRTDMKHVVDAITTRMSGY